MFIGKHILSFSTCSANLLTRLIVCLGACFFSSAAQSEQQFELQFELHSIVSEMPASWAIKVSPSNQLTVTHRSGSLSFYNLNSEHLNTIDLELDDLYYEGQGGLLGIAFYPDFDIAPWIYVSYTFGNAKANGLKVIRFKLTSESTLPAIQAKQTIFTQAKSSLRDTAAHYGGRLLFLADKTLLISTGDGFDYREQAQLKSSQLGKILRINADGSLPKDNPFLTSTAEQLVYTLGHRNPQALAILPTGQIVAHEHGPDGGDELNIIESGKNYGWPVVTLGKDYLGGLISPFSEYQNMVNPQVNWTPSIAPSGMIYYSHNRISAFTNSLLISTLKNQQIYSLRFHKGQFVSEQIYFSGSPYRMRDLSSSKDGRLFILSDGQAASILEVRKRK